MEEQQKKSWWQRNWAWALPVGGCGCGCLVVLLFVVFGVGATFFGVSKMFNDATPVKYALELSNNNQKVVAVLGDFIEKNGVPSGNISLRNDDGEIDFSIPIKGTKASGSLIIKGIKVNGEWVYEELYVLFKSNQESINLLEKIPENL